MRNKLSPILFLMFLLISCKQESVNGIIIGGSLYDNQTITDNKTLCNIINRTLNKEQGALVDLIGFGCGGGAGCYDLGYVITQIVKRVGEREFADLTKNFTKNQRSELLGLIRVGLEYGDNNYDGKIDNATIDMIYPTLKLILTKDVN